MDKEKEEYATDLTPLLKDVEKLKQLANVLKEYDLSAVEISEEDKKYRVEKKVKEKVFSGGVDVTQEAQQAVEEIKTINSPIVGVFYDSLSPEKGVLVSKGQKFKKGDILCVLEAMKTFTEIPAEDDGEILEICAKNGDIIEYGQVLFKYA